MRGSGIYRIPREGRENRKYSLASREKGKEQGREKKKVRETRKKWERKQKKER